MKHREHIQVHVIVVDIMDDAIQTIPGDLTMADSCPLGQAGGAAGEHNGSDVFFHQCFAHAGRGG